MKFPTSFSNESIGLIHKSNKSIKIEIIQQHPEIATGSSTTLKDKRIDALMILASTRFIEHEIGNDAEHNLWSDTSC